MINVLVHSTGELEELLGEQIVAREQIHAWPLSSIELLTTAGGSRWVYKAQREPTVEPEFFGRARTRLLPSCQILQRDAQQAVLLLPFVGAPTLRDQNLDEAALVEHGRALIRQIADIGGDPPVYIDIGTVEAWREFAAMTLDMLSALVRDGMFTRTTNQDIDGLTGWVQTRAVLDAVDRTSQLINGDLKAEHVFCTEQGYQVIDWQRPYRAPGDIDLVLLLDSLKIPAHSYVGSVAIGLRWFLFVHWAAEAKANLLPALPLFDDWTRLGIDMIQSVAK
jgi:hypothetical protein